MEVMGKYNEELGSGRAARARRGDSALDDERAGHLQERKAQSH